jgi:hypothetical protein
MNKPSQPNTCLLCRYFWECIFRSEKGRCDRFEREIKEDKDAERN